MIAALPMYDRPETAPAADRFWALVRDGLRRRGQHAPAALWRGTPPLRVAAGPDTAQPGAPRGRITAALPLPEALMALWLNPRLVLSQTCGLPYRLALHGRVCLLATPDPGLPDCPPGYYRSAIVTRRSDPRGALEDFAGALAAVNDAASQSGWAALDATLRAVGLPPAPVLLTGSHRASALAVARGAAALAAIDATSWAVMRRWDDWTGDLRVLCFSQPTPALPLIAHDGADRPALVGALHEALDALPARFRRDLGLRALVEIPAAAYLAQPCPPPPRIASV